MHYLPLTPMQQALENQHNAFVRRVNAILSCSTDSDEAHNAWIVASSIVQKMQEEKFKTYSSVITTKNNQ